jgi:hypothetical protein
MSGKSGGRVGGLTGGGSGWGLSSSGLGMALVLEDVRLTRVDPCLFRWASKHGQRGWHLSRPLAEYLRECGYLVLEAFSAADARTLLEDGSRRVDIPTLHTRTPRPCFYHYL